MKSRIVDRLALAVAVAIFCAAIVALLREFASVSPREVVTRLVAMPPRQLLLALALTVANYLLLTGYDFLALRYVGRRLPFRDVLLVSFTAFAFSNNIGVQMLSGGSTRYRLYSDFGLQAVEIGEIVAFCTLAYALGMMTIGGLLALLDPGEIAALLHLPTAVIIVSGVALLGCCIGYLAVSAVWRRPLRLGHYHLRPPSLSLALAQMALASFDAALSSTVLYALLPADVTIDYRTFLCIFVIAATSSVLSLVPAGLGVLETAITLMMAFASKAAMLSTFFAYRIIYFVLPLIVALVIFAVHEARWYGRRS